jgi:hypothetical protein
VVYFSGCSTIGHTLVFNGENQAAFAAITADGMNNEDSYNFIFKKVNLEHSVFSSGSFTVYFASAGDLGGDEFKKPVELNTTRRFGGGQVPAGTYALVGRFDSVSRSRTRTFNCFSLGTPVFNIVGGSIDVLNVGDVKAGAIVSNPAVESQWPLVLAGYPNMSAPVRTAEILGFITFLVSTEFSACFLLSRLAAVLFDPSIDVPLEFLHLL